jgi:hypothetical protein
LSGIGDVKRQESTANRSDVCIFARDRDARGTALPVSWPPSPDFEAKLNCRGEGRCLERSKEVVADIELQNEAHAEADLSSSLISRSISLVAPEAGWFKSVALTLLALAAVLRPKT